jgi:hypothetical protein
LTANSRLCGTRSFAKAQDDSIIFREHLVPTVLRGNAYGGKAPTQEHGSQKKLIEFHLRALRELRGE